MTLSLPALNPIPSDIEDQLRRLLHSPQDPAIGDWLLELIKSSGHLSTGDDMQWRLLCMVWFTMVYDTEAGWPYLQWLNTGEATITTHLREMLMDAVDNFYAHVAMANWLVDSKDERLQTFFQDFYPIPSRHRMAPLMTRLLREPARPETGVWLEMFCQGTAYNEGNYMRSWRLLAIAWLAAQFSAVEGLPYLYKLNNNQKTLSSADNALLMEAASEANGMTAMIEMIANCDNAAVKTMLAEFGHPNLAQIASDTLQAEADYTHLSGSSEDAAARLAFFSRCRADLESAGILPKSGPVIDLACGPLAEQALLFASVGYNVTAVDIEIPPGYLPLSGLTPWFKRRKHSKAWQAVTNSFYRALAQQSGLKLNWNKVSIKLADVTRLDEMDNDFAVAICANYLHHAPDVSQLLAEAARVLKPGGLLVANIRPYAGFTGAFQVDTKQPWAHLQANAELMPQLPLNRWRETQYKQAIANYFDLQQWLPELDDKVKSLLTPTLKESLADYDEAELICRQIWLVARKK